ncbi:signal peptidase I [Haloarchaeobius salinus]|uniref:signal peptidase I n=1 Tax=Haloarchaeobius salinus TaxID=1198298 RepID=UPI0021099932|nr:signal peptidase I [Haloarchaeobius salinus]
MVDARRILHVLGLLVLVVVVVPFVVYAFPGAVGADHSFVVLSGSMEPEISPGDVVIVDERPTAAIEEGDVVTFVRGEGDKPVTHRVVGVEERGDTTVFTTKGDANEDVDSQPIPAGNVIGEVAVTIPYIGHVIQFAQRPVGFVVLVLLPLGLLGLSEVWAIVRKQGGDGGTVADGGGGTVATSATTTGSATVTEADADDGDGEVTLTATDLTLATGILLLVAPYTVYVALQLRNPVTFTAAFAAVFSFLGVAGLWLTARRGDTGQPATAPDSPGDGDGGEDGDEDGFSFVDDSWEDEADWTLPDDDSFGFDGDDGLDDGEPDTAFGTSAAGADDGAAVAGDPAPDASQTAPEPEQRDGTSVDDGFFDEPAPDVEPTDSGVFDDTTGGTEEVD